MIVRITFVGIIKDAAGHKKGLKDYMDVHIGSVAEAKQCWKRWVSKNSGMKGASGIFHPLDGFGDIIMKSIEEKTEDEGE